MITPRAITKIAIELKIVAAPSLSTYAAKNPPIQLATAEESIQTPIKRDANLTGANFVIIDSPTGDRHNSPIVWKK